MRRLDVPRSNDHGKCRTPAVRQSRRRVRCLCCGTRSYLPIGQPFCAKCLDWSRDAGKSEWDDLGWAD